MIDIYEYIKKTKEDRQAHCDFEEPCVERGSNSTMNRALLAHVLDTNIPKGSKIVLCHGCHNDKCCNPKHLYWGTCKENARDAIDNGTRLSVWEYMVNKHGEQYAQDLNRENGLKSKGRPNFGSRKPKSEEHKRKISQSLMNNSNAALCPSALIGKADTLKTC